MVVTAIGWAVLGLIAGLVSGKLVKKRGGWPWHDVSLGVIGAVTTGWMLTVIGATDVKGFNVWSPVIAVVGAVALLVAMHLLVGVVGLAGLLLMVWDAIRGSGPEVRDRHNHKERI